MHNPSHPGAVLADTVLRKDGGISVTEFAKALNVSRVALSRVVNQRAGVSAELAIRLAAALGTSPEVWLSMHRPTIYGTLKGSGGRASCVYRLPHNSERLEPSTSAL
jgi:addiction module HigA family antidote